jgi:hypothetical protein
LRKINFFVDCEALLTTLFSFDALHCRCSCCQENKITTIFQRLTCQKPCVYAAPSDIWKMPFDNMMLRSRRRNVMNDTSVTVMPDLFDRQIGALHGIPDVLSTKPAVVQAVTPIVGDAQTFTVQTYRQPEIGDTIFIQCVSKTGTIRLTLPAPVANAIARQRDALTSKSRSRRAKAVAQARKDRGELPGFMRRRQ